MNVGIVGSGQVAQALARGFAALGHRVKLGSRTPEKLSDFVGELGGGASAGTFAEAAEFGELGVLATLWSGTEHALELAEARRTLGGKVVIDVTNPLVFHEGGPPTLALGHTDSGGEQVQRWLPESRVVKAFTIVGNTLFFRPGGPGGPPTMLKALTTRDSGSQRCTCSPPESVWPSANVGGPPSWKTSGLVTSMTTLPARVRRPSASSSAGSVPDHSVASTPSSPNSAAWANVSADAPWPSSSTKSASFSGVREPSLTWWPRATKPRASAWATRPEPTTPTFMAPSLRPAQRSRSTT